MKLKKIVKYLGSEYEVAKVCGVSRQAVNKWIRVPENHQDKVRKAVYLRQVEINLALLAINQYIKELENER
jgi:predicted transcriptional regulator